MLDAMELSPQLQDFITLFLGLIVEAFPFVVLGVLVSALVGVFLSEQTVLKLLPKNKFVSHFVIAFMGVLMPVCECGNVPVVRRLVVNGFTASQAITFLLAAPIINPVTVWSTAEAFGWDSPVVVVRVLAALAISVGVGLVFSMKKDQNSLLADKFYEVYCDHDHDHDHGHEKSNGKGVKFYVDNLAGIAQQEFIAVMPALVFGASIAAGVQSFLPREVIANLGSSPLLSIIAMLVMAFVVSICANVDAFFALSYAQNFTLGSILSFLVFGPMVDIKILSMSRTTFKTRTLLTMSLLVLLGSFITGLLVNYFV